MDFLAADRLGLCSRHLGFFVGLFFWAGLRRPVLFFCRYFIWSINPVTDYDELSVVFCRDVTFLGTGARFVMCLRADGILYRAYMCTPVYASLFCTLYRAYMYTPVHMQLYR